MARFTGMMRKGSSAQPSMLSLVEEYLVLRRRLGFSMRSGGWRLRNFARYADGTCHRGPITAELAMRWARQPERSPRSWAHRLSTLRPFARYRLLFDPGTEIPPTRCFGSANHRPTPYIYSQDEIGALMRAAARLAPSGGTISKTIVALFGLLVSTGMRISEALRLNLSDVDLTAGVITINESKFQRQRVVPLHASACDALRRYLRLRHYQRPSESQAFFLAESGRSLRYWRVREIFVELRARLGWTGHQGRPPRIHDIRHTFAVSRLLRWYEEGADVDNRIATLSRYLGHVSVIGTYWYLSAVPELMTLVSKRYQRFIRSGGGRP